ncbi:hypothetical protein [Actinomycetospora sp. CA-084318]|uniref:hypothetical protein n=1 Tax=Actinomycetospora sp. CA-084318 TaxID=3239892 RepID=UPI003D9565C8
MLPIDGTGPAAVGSDRAALTERVEAALRRVLQIRVPVVLLDPGVLPETTFKARRVVDERTRRA